MIYVNVYVISMLFLYFLYIFFFFKQKTAYDMRISDWSSDVCSSDLSRNRRVKAAGSASPARSPKKPNPPASKAACISARNSRRNTQDSTRTGRKNPAWQATQRVQPACAGAGLSEGPPPGTTQWTREGWRSARSSEEQSGGKGGGR